MGEHQGDEEHEKHEKHENKARAVLVMVGTLKEPATGDLAAVNAAFDALMAAKKEEMDARAAAFAEAVKGAGAGGAVALSKQAPVLDKLAEVLAGSDKKKATEREAAAKGVKAVLSCCGAVSEPFLVRLLEPLFVLLADKAGKASQTAAEEALDAIVGALSSQGKKMFALPAALKMLGQDHKFQTQAGALQIILKIANEAPEEIGSCMPDLVPPVSALMNDAKAVVAEHAVKTIEAGCASIDNTDIQPLVPALISALKNPAEVEDAVFKLAATTFVQQVECNALAITVPLLKRGFQTRKTPVMRMCARIIENMAKLVERQRDVAPFMPTLMPALQDAAEQISDPEARQVCSNASEILQRAFDGVGMPPQPPVADYGTTLKAVEEVMKAEGAVSTEILSFMATCFVALIDAAITDIEAWQANTAAYLKPFECTLSVEEFAKQCLEKCSKYMVAEEEEEEDTDAELLCDCKFSLAYGSKVLLNNTRMTLKRGFRYGLVGPNECGKTTLMRAIANGQVDGFPPADEVRTVFVEADILGELSHLAVVDYIYADPKIQAVNIPREEITNVLSSVGFTPTMLKGAVSHLSGGWRMKLALGRAMLQRADILLLDEPTNHLDVVNVKWVEDYLNNLTNVTSIMCSHDSGLLERVCTHIIQIEALKLRIFKGNLSEFVKREPRAKSYFELKATNLSFKFPQPGNLEGITSKGKPIMKMDGVEFTYPGVHRPQVSGVTIRVSLSSRVACIGPNGAGKSTIIKLLTGEVEPQIGNVWKHPNARVAYVAQHAFHHIEMHLDKTPNQYIQWRYEYGDDKEALVKDSMTATDDELKVMKQKFEYRWKSEDGLKEYKENVVIRSLTGQRRTAKGTKNEYEYEVKFEGKPATFTAWLNIDKLEKIGWGKELKKVDEKVASRSAAFQTPLTSSNVEKHLENIGLDKEYGTHCRIGQLSGGQKVKVVLAAAMWNHPHIVILDEPTNYLDRESLGALAEAIKSFEGGVVVISHNSEFTSAVCPEVWNMQPATETEAAKLILEGDQDWLKTVQQEKVEIKQIEEMVDAFGNTVKVQQQKKKALSRADKKKLERKRAAQIKNGTYVKGCNGSDSEDDL
ncbi:Elongation factor 3B [Porphyridium purpureum]|uniref:Elongation factor 3 n=1 Tax=Porphyridium purpureum TaxID=35688 RepID=A0A5J4Z553_PORPP|nr:Elongation factor 3B [Porphyridium purpureum]|eukprot:POR0405..scf295_1